MESIASKPNENVSISINEYNGSTTASTYGLVQRNPTGTLDPPPPQSNNRVAEIVASCKDFALTFLGLNPPPTINWKEFYGPITEVLRFLSTLRLYMPYSPALTSPGWLVQYCKGVAVPESRASTLESLFNDVMAGITVALLLIPQGLSYAKLALLPPVNGLYAAILPCAVYAIFGSSMQLAVGPVAISSLLTGSLISKYNIDYTKYPQDAADLAAQAAMGMGIILIAMSILNIGALVRFIGYPVMSGKA